MFAGAPYIKLMNNATEAPMRYYTTAELDAAQTEAPLTLHIDAPSGYYRYCTLMAVRRDGCIEVEHEGEELTLRVAECKVVRA